MRRALSLILMVVLAACGDPDDRARPPLKEVARPALERFERPVAEALAEAQLRFDAALAGEGADPATAWGELGMAYHAHHLYELAAASYENAWLEEQFSGAAREGPERGKKMAGARWLYYLGVVRQETGEFGSAAIMFKGFLGEQPDYLPARLRLADTLFAAGREASARSYWEAVLQDAPNDAAALAGLGRVALAESEYSEAVEYFRAALASQPAATKLYHPLAMALRGAGETEAAAAALARRGERDVSYADPMLAEVMAMSRSAQFYLAPALDAARDGRYAEAVTLFRRAIEVDAGDPAAHAGLARALESMGELDEAMRAVNEALALDPEHVLSLYQLGVLHERGGDDAAAIEAYQRAIALDPAYAEPRFLMANALMRRSDYAAAAEHYLFLTRMLPDTVRVHYRLALAYFADGDCAKSMPPLERASDLNRASAPVVEALARVYATCAAADEARRRQSLEDAQWLFTQVQTEAFAETLAMALAANASWDQAVTLQSQLVKQTAPGTELHEWRSANLRRYQSKQRAVSAWPAAAQEFRPVPVSARERGGSQPSS